MPAKLRRLESDARAEAERVRSCLLEIAAGDSRILRRPIPEVEFRAFDEGELQFVLYLWLDPLDREHLRDVVDSTLRRVEDLVLDPPTTMLGLLQRGRGLGFQRALAGEHDEGAAGLLACLRRDPRWDAQAETRELYYADVATAVGLPVAEIHGVLRELADAGEETRCYGQYLAAGVLGILAARGDHAALDTLIGEVRTGPAWLVCADELTGVCPRGVWAPLGKTLFERLSRDELQGLAADCLYFEPWSTWQRTIDRYKNAVESVEAPRDVRPEEPGAPKADTSLSTSALLELVERRNWRKIGNVLEARRRPSDQGALVAAVREGTSYQKAAALWGLATLGDAVVLDDALELVRTTKSHWVRRQALMYLAELPARLTHNRALRWLEEPWPVPLAGREVLSRHATAEDAPLLCETLASALEEDDMYKACFAIDAFACFEARGAHTSLQEFYEATPYAYVRWRAARALALIRDDFPRSIAIECLYDCEPQAKLLGLEHVDGDSLELRKRIAQLAADPAEEDEVRAAAGRAQVRH